MNSESITIGREKATVPERIPPVSSKPLTRYLELELLLHNSHEKHKKIRMGWSSTSLLKTFFDQIPSPT